MLTKHLAQSWTRNNLYTYFASEKTDRSCPFAKFSLQKAIVKSAGHNVLCLIKGFIRSV